MPPAKKATRTAGKRATTKRATTKRATSKRTAAKRTAAKRGATRSAARTMSSSHKKALSEGRALSSTVDRYLAAVNTPKRRGRKVSKATLVQRLANAQQRLKSAKGVDKVLAAQEVRDLQTKIARLNAANAFDVKSLEDAFVKIAKRFGDNRGIGYGAWRDAGVPAEVLRRAGVTRTRS